MRGVEGRLYIFLKFIRFCSVTLPVGIHLRYLGTFIVHPVMRQICAILLLLLLPKFVNLS